jgi:hypothetical protein
VTSRLPWFPEYIRENYPARGRLFGDFLGGLWATACDALEVPVDHAVRTTRMLRGLLPSWSGDVIGARPARPSYVAADGFPAEMSVNWSGDHPELRVLFDTLGEEDPDSPVDTGETRYWGRIHELFTTRAGRPSTAPLWHSVAWRPPSRIVHKSYFGLYEWPLSHRYAAVGEAMDRLGLSAAWDDARRRVELADGEREIEFFAVDVADGADARVKVYYRNHGADLTEVNRVASAARHHDAGAAAAAYRTLTGGRESAGVDALSCLAFRSGADRAAEATTYLRLPSLATGDAEAVDRTAGLLRGEGVDPGRFRALAAALAPGPLEGSTGLLELVSHRAAGRRGDITTYFRFPVYDQTLATVDLG